MQTKLISIWERSTAYYCAHLRDSDRIRMQQVQSQQELLGNIRSLKVKYSKVRVSQALDKAETFAAYITAFTKIIDIFIPTDPRITALLWGPIALILQLAARHQETLELISDIFEQIEQASPRFQKYIDEFGCGELSERLQDALVIYYAELISHYQESISFLLVPASKNLLLLNRPATKFHHSAKRRLEVLRDKTSWVEYEANWIKHHLQQQQHDEMLKLLRKGFHTASKIMTSPKLPYRSLPFSRNYHFHFRANILRQVEEALQPEVPATSLRAAGLFGLGGAGKTQIALEFAYRHAKDYDAIFWFHAETETKLIESLRGHLRAFESESEYLALPNITLFEMFHKLLMTVSNTDGQLIKWLIILDNIEYRPVIHRFWPKDSHGSILVTTRSQELAHDFGSVCLEVPLFTQAESSDFLMHFNKSADASVHGELQTVSDIATRLGCLPLALNQIGAYVRNTATSYQAFLQFYNDFDTNLLFYSQPLTAAYENSLQNTWTISLSTMEKDAKAFMETLSLFDPDGVPLALLECGDKEAKMYNGPSDEFPNLGKCLSTRLPDRQATDNVITKLLGSALITRSRDGSRVSCHRIVREAVLRSLEIDTLVFHFDWATFALNACFPKTPHGAPLLKDWDECATFHPHVSALFTVYRRKSPSLVSAILLCEVLRRCAWYLIERGSFKNAAEMITQSCPILEKIATGGSHPGYYPNYLCRLIADMWTMMGSIEYETNAPSYGRSWFEKAGQHRRRPLDNGTANSSDIESSAIIEANIALTYLAEGTAGRALTSYHTLLDNFDTESSRAIWAANLSIAYRVSEQLDESLTWCRRSFDWTLRAFGEQSLSLAIVHFNTACTLLEMRQDKEALSALQKCLDIRQNKSPYHPYTGFTCHKIGLVLRSRGDFQKAATFFRSAVSIISNCESYAGAALRSQFALALALEGMEMSSEASGLKSQISNKLQSFGESVDEQEITEAYFNKFVLYCHR